MSKGEPSTKPSSKVHRPSARVPKGFRDISAATVRAEAQMLARIREVYERYGFDPLETSAIEYADALGKFLPDEDRPNEGVFAFQDDDEQWMALRYDLTAPLARYVAEHFDGLPKPFRRYQVGPVWRNEKPGPGRFRQFTQFDADTVGTPTVAADAEMCMMAADCFEALGIARGGYRLRVNNRKVLDGLLETIGIAGEEAGAVATRMTVLRSIDKFDKLGRFGVELLLGAGRKDESGDFTKGAGLEPGQIARVLDYVESGLGAVGSDAGDRKAVLEGWRAVVGASARGNEGIDELLEMDALFASAGYGIDRIEFNSWIVRGLGYYTGPVFESELLFEVKDEKGNPVRFGSVGSGGRYDDLVERFKGVKVPATGFSIGISRLYTALDLLGQIRHDSAVAPVVVLTLGDMAASQSMVRDLREAGIRAEMYLGGSGMRAQVKYADKRGAPVAVIEGEDERAQGIVTLKDLILGAEMSREIEDNAKWREGQPAQVSVPRADLVQAVKDILARHGLHRSGL
ncbi:MAG: histidine--tRNA ligase [Parvibaculaceae bacterium]|nr:histidine--tRNA ligase [Parvibaculaceae bacterium]